MKETIMDLASYSLQCNDTMLWNSDTWQGNSNIRENCLLEAAKYTLGISKARE